MTDELELTDQEYKSLARRQIVMLEMRHVAIIRILQDLGYGDSKSAVMRRALDEAYERINADSAGR